MKISCVPREVLARELGIDSKRLREWSLLQEPMAEISAAARNYITGVKTGEKIEVLG